MTVETLNDADHICLNCTRPEMRHFVVAEVVRLRVELPTSLRTLTSSATPDTYLCAGPKPSGQARWRVAASLV